MSWYCEVTTTCSTRAEPGSQTIVAVRVVVDRPAAADWLNLRRRNRDCRGPSGPSPGTQSPLTSTATIGHGPGRSRPGPPGSDAVGEKEEVGVGHCRRRAARPVADGEVTVIRPGDVVGPGCDDRVRRLALPVVRPSFARVGAVVVFVVPGSTGGPASRLSGPAADRSLTGMPSGRFRAGSARDLADLDIDLRRAWLRRLTVAGSVERRSGRGTTGAGVDECGTRRVRPGKPSKTDAEATGSTGPGRGAVVARVKPRSRPRRLSGCHHPGPSRSCAATMTRGTEAGGTMRLWGGRFGEDNDARVADFTRSIEIDAELAVDDLRGSIAHVRGLGRAGLLTDDEVGELVEGLEGLAGEVEAGDDRMGPGTRGRPPEPRVGARGTHRAGRRQAPHGPLAERPGRDGPSALAAPGDRPARRGHPRDGARARRPGGAGRRRRSCPGPPTSSRPSRCSSPTTCSRTSRCSSAIGAGWPTPAPRERQPARIGRPRRRGLPDRPRGRRRRARVRRRHGQLARRGQRPRFRRRGACRSGPRDGPPEPPRRGDHLVVEPAVRVRPRRRRVLDGQLDDAEQAEPRPAELVRASGRAYRRTDGHPR